MKGEKMTTALSNFYLFWQITVVEENSFFAL